MSNPSRAEKRRQTYRSLTIRGIKFVGTPASLSSLLDDIPEKDPSQDLALQPVTEDEYFRGAWIIVDKTLQLPDVSEIFHVAKHDLVAAVEYLEEILPAHYSVTLEIGGAYAGDLLKSR